MTTYYVDATTGSDSDSGLTEALAWQTLSKVESFDADPGFAAGDSVLFKRGESWAGPGTDNSITLTIASDGTSQNRITLGAYGSGDDPTFSNATGNLARIIRLAGDYITIDGLKLQNCNESGIYIPFNTTGHIVQNCEITGVGIGIYMYGTGGLATSNYIHDLEMVYEHETEGYGAVGIWFFASGNEASYNTLINCTAIDSVSGNPDGRAFEWYAASSVSVDGCHIHHNFCRNTNGFWEVGSDGTASIQNTLFHHNVLIEGTDEAAVMGWIGNLGSTSFSSWQVHHNTAIISEPGDNGWVVIGFATNPGSAFELRNNLIVADGLTNISNYGTFIHTHNLYDLRDGTTVGFTLDGTEIDGDAEFVKETAENLHLGSGSAAIEAGMNLGYLVDYDGIPLGRGTNPDLGAFETLKGGPRGL